MSFENRKVAVSQEAETENRLNFTAVCPDATEQYKHNRVERTADVHDWVRNDEIVKQASESWDRIMTKFDTLPDSYKKELLASFAPHMYNNNEDYPMYNRLINKHAQQTAEQAAMNVTLA
jgi:hypothetical protein